MTPNQSRFETDKVCFTPLFFHSSHVTIFLGRSAQKYSDPTKLLHFVAFLVNCGENETLFCSWETPSPGGDPCRAWNTVPGGRQGQGAQPRHISQEKYRNSAKGVSKGSLAGLRPANDPHTNYGMTQGAVCQGLPYGVSLRLPLDTLTTVAERLVCPHPHLSVEFSRMRPGVHRFS